MSLQERLNLAFEPVQAALDSGQIPGAILGVVDTQGNRAVHASGWAQKTPTSRPMHENIWFDLASLTKVLFTAPRILALHEEGILSLEEPLISVIPDLQQYNSDSWIRKITFAQCLSHQTAFPAVEPIYTYGRDPSLLRAFVLQRKWQEGPAVYSDINFILLGLVLERISGKCLRELTAGEGFAFSAKPEQSAATEFCTWREQLMCGEVHDDNCYALQGAGHAGLFGTAGAVLDHAQGLLDGSIATDTCIRLMRKKISETRTLGWECAHDGWHGGSKCSDETIGHTGFTGTGLWIDFESGFAWTLLTNRIHPTRHNDSGIHTLRKTVGDKICNCFES